jgi:hypothetical protein
MMYRTTTIRHRQRGSTLLVAMIFLMLFALMAVSVFRSSLTSVQTIANMQWRTEAIEAAQDVIDRLLSTADFANNATLVTQQVNDAPFGMDANGDGVADILVTFPVVTLDGVAKAGPRCLRAEPIPNKDLDPTKPGDTGCFSSSTYEGGIAIDTSSGGSAPLTAGTSLCANTEWTITVRATDVVTNTSVDVVQGVGVRVPTVAVPECI